MQIEANVRCWLHKAVIPPCPLFGRYRGKSGHRPASVLLVPTLSYKRCSRGREGHLLGARRLATGDFLAVQQQLPMPFGAAGPAIGVQPDFGLIHNISPQKLISHQNNLD